MGKGKYEPTAFEHARDELFSHIQRCGVIEAEFDQRAEWLDETMEYLTDRYPELSNQQIGELKKIGLRYCNTPIPHGDTDAREIEEYRKVDEAAGVA